MASTNTEHLISSLSESPSVEKKVEDGHDTAKYVYQPLAPDQIRIVHLFQFSETSHERLFEKDKGLYCVLQHVDASHANYTALSYEWGDSRRPFSIQVHDEQGMPLGSIGLTRNLRNALADLIQSKVEPKAFWIDQLCIDQSDNKDKASQESPALKFHVDPQKPVWAGLCRLIVGGWLKRRWMVQENTLNLNTYFLRGQQKLNHTDGSLIIFLIHARILPFPPENDKELRLAIVKFGHTVGGLEYCKARSMKLRDLLWWFSQTQCQNPRDRVFSLLGVAADAPSLNITVDYERTESQVLANTAAGMLEHNKTLNFLAYAGGHTSVLEYLPSWVPYWDTHVDTYPSNIKNEAILRAASSIQVQHAFVDGGQTLILKGLILGKLQSCLGIWGPLFIRNSFALLYQGSVEDVRQKLGILDNIRQHWGSLEQYDLMLACTLGALTDNSLSGEFTSADTIFRAFQSALNLLRHSPLEVTDAPSHKKEVSSMATGMTDDERLGRKFIRGIHIRNRSFWTMNDKFLCLAPDTAKTDDLVVVLFGGRVLYILRPTSEAGRYHFIGTAYVQDFMDGEAMQDPEWEQNVKSFSLHAVGEAVPYGRTPPYLPLSTTLVIKAEGCKALQGKRKEEKGYEESERICQDSGSIFAVFEYCPYIHVKTTIYYPSNYLYRQEEEAGLVAGIAWSQRSFVATKSTSRLPLIHAIINTPM
ncbi:hypothetical protein B7463_g5066, partial [Scytalidium lignicola]